VLVQVPVREQQAQPLLAWRLPQQHWELPAPASRARLRVSARERAELQQPSVLDAPDAASS